jgi:5'-nucleotidase
MTNNTNNANNVKDANSTNQINNTATERTWNVVVSNDDGIESEGIGHLIKALSQVADVYVCAPEGERSASGHSITVRNPIIMEEVEVPHAKGAMRFSGTPADCVKMGIRFLRERGLQIDMVFSGINHGGNLGTDTLYSGTVAAAIEGVLCGVPGVAVSVDSHRPEYFDTACKLALQLFEKVKEGIPEGIALNLNVPNLPADEVKGLRCASLGMRQYIEQFEETINQQGQTEYWYRGLPVIYNCAEVSNDVTAMQQRYATLTPLKFDLTEEKYLQKICDWELTI